MARVNAPLLAFNRGEVSKHALGRVDIEKLQLSAECQLNLEPRVIGPMALRPGLEFIGEMLSDQAGRILPFVFAPDDTALLELTPNMLRIRVNDVLVTRPSVATAVSDPNFAGGGSWSTGDTTSGASVSIGGGVCTLTCTPVGGIARVKQHITVAAPARGVEHGIRIVITNGPVTVRAGSTDGLSDLIGETTLDTGTHALACTPNSDIYLQIESTDARAKTLTSVSIDAAGVLSLPTPWGADLATVRPSQSGDVVFVAAYGMEQYKIERRSAHGWSIVLYRSDNGPFRNGPGITANFSPSIYNGNGTLTSDRSYFQPGHVGALFRLFSSGQYNRTTLGANNAFTPPVRVVGVGAAARNYEWSVQGTYSGILTLQRSFDGPNAGFVDVAAQANGYTGTIASHTGGTGGSPDLDNAVCWERVGFVGNKLTVASATIVNGGTGYDLGQVLTVVGGVLTAGGSPATFGVTNQAGGVVTAISLLTPGSYSELPTNPVATTCDGGAGCTLNLTPSAGAYASGVAEVSSNYSGGGGFGICRVTGYNSPTSLDIEVLSPFSSLAATSDWLEQDWSAVVGFPTAVGFFEGRLAWTGRDEMWFSQSNNYTGYAQQDLQGNPLGDAGAIIESFGEGPVDRVNWVLSLTRPLFGREGSIAAARSSSFDEPLTPINFSVKDCSTQGAARLPAIKVDKRGVFVQQSGRRVYELLFEASALDYTARDLTRLNIDIGKPGFTDIAIARQPDTALYLPRSDGQCAVLLYDPDDDVVAWWRMQTLGVIENVCVLPCANGYEDYVYFIVRRLINGVTRRFIERLATRDSCVGGLANQLLDSHVVYSGAATATFTAAHLPNTTVEVWADGVAVGSVTTNGGGVGTLPNGLTASKIVAGLGGATVSYSGAPVSSLTGLAAYEGLTAEVFADQQPSGRMVRLGSFTVAGGAIALPANLTSASIVAFFGYTAPFMSAKLAYAAQMGSPLSQKKKVDHLGLVLFDTHARGVKYGQRFDKLDDLPLVQDGGDVDGDSVWNEFDQPVISVPGEWNSDARLCLLAQAPYPFAASGAIVAVATNER